MWETFSSTIKAATTLDLLCLQLNDGNHETLLHAGYAKYIYNI